MGELYALGAAIVWAWAVILLQRSGESAGPFALNLFRIGVSLPLLILTTLLAGIPLLRPAPLSDYLILLASGVIGIAISDTLFHRSLNMVGAGISAIVGTAYSPTVVLMAFLLIGERVGAADLVGMGLILCGILLSTSLRPPRERTRLELIEGILLGVLSIATLAFAIVIAKPVLDRSPVLWAASVRQSGCIVALLLSTLFLRRTREAYRFFRPSPAWRFMLPAAVLGSYLSLMLWIAGMKYTLASLAAILNQTSTIFILLLAVIFLREPLSRRKLLAAGLAIGGVLLITLT
ncbi:MAG: EamA family transporter [Candidatus Eisenbacteria bacterium]|nr:EamA family transporter [Candidatus Eisenbacteria bacterium]